MKTKRFLFVLFVLMALLPASAMAETISLNSSSTFFTGGAPGETWRPAYPDMTKKISYEMSQDDFNITYSTQEKASVLTVAPDGTVTIGPEAQPNYNYEILATYSPKVAGVGSKKTFTFTLKATEKLTGITASSDDLVMDAAGREEVSVAPEGTTQRYTLLDVSYDASVVSVTTKTSSSGWTLTISAAGGGETDVVVRGYNGVEKKIHVWVVPRPTKIELASDFYSCHVGETIDLGLDMGNGTLLFYPNVALRLDGVRIDTGEYFPEDVSHFYAAKAGHYTVSVTSLQAYGKSDVATISVYEDGKCDAIKVSTGQVYKDRENMRVTLYDAAGSPVVLPMRITEGGDVATLNGSLLTATGTGTITISVQNSDGTVTSQSFEVIENPTEMYLNTTDLTMDIGDVFDLEVTFDQGSYPHQIKVDNMTHLPEYELVCIRMEGDRIIAQAAGKARLCITAGPLTIYLHVTVLDSDAALVFVTPPAPFGVGHTFQLAVKDRTGKEYPATFRSGFNHTVTVTPDGRITGLKRGSYYIMADLEDGRKLTLLLRVEQVPMWIQHPSLTASISQGSVAMKDILSDVGVILNEEVELTIADPSIATREYSRLRLKSVGTTTITMTSIHSGAQTTFQLEVLPENDKLYAGSAEILVPYGYYTVLPGVTDYEGNPVEVTWAITHDSPGQGNPENSGFVLDGDAIACVWPTAACEVTGTAADGMKVKVSVLGYKLSEAIHMSESALRLAVGEFANIQVVNDEAGSLLGDYVIVSENESVATVLDYIPSENRYTVIAGEPGTTVIVAMLLNGAYTTCEVTVYDPNARVPGDVNEDGKINSRDALAVIRYAVGQSVSINTANADVNADSKINSRDALAIIRYAVGQDVVLK